MAPAVEVDELDSTERGAGGFGSTGVAAAPGEDPSKRAKVWTSFTEQLQLSLYEQSKDTVKWFELFNLLLAIYYIM